MGRVTTPSISQQPFTPQTSKPSKSLNSFLGIEDEPSFDVSSFSGQTPTSTYQRPDIDFSKEFTVDDLEKNEGLFNAIKDAQVARRNKAFDPDKQSRKDYINEYLADERFATFNTIGTVGDLDYIKNANPEDAQKVAVAKRIYENTKSFYEAGGQSGISPVLDIAKAIVVDPTSYIGFGAGKVATGAAVRAAAGAATKELATAGLKSVGKKAALVSAVTDGAISVASSVTDQKLTRAVSEALDEEPEDISLGIAGVVGLVSASLSGAAAYKSISKDPNTYVGVLAEKIKERKGKVVAPTLAQPPTPIEKAAADATTINMDATVEAYMKTYGAALLEEIDPAGVITDSKVKETFVRTTVQAAFKVMQSNDEFMPKPGEKAMNALGRVIANSESIDGTFIESGLKQLGISKEQYAAMFVKSASDAGKTLGSMGVVGKWMNSLRDLGPDFQKQFDSLYGKEDEYTGAFAKGVDIIRRIERESKVWITSGIDTLARNIVGTTTGLTVKSAVTLLEGFVYSAGIGARDAMTGQGFDRAKKTMADSFHDAIDVWFKLMSPKGKSLAVEAVDEILKFNPTIRDTLFSALQETGNQEISKLGRWANTLNVAVDGVYRRATFTASIEKQLRDQGLDLYVDFIDKNKPVPQAVLKRAMDDALKTTFSYMPKQHKASQRGLESSFETGAAALISTIEKTPFSSLAIPFPRFMANAMAFQYRYSPFGPLGAGKDLLLSKQAEKAGDIAKATFHLRQAHMKYAQGAVGTAALLSAYHYRKNNQDKDWYTVGLTDGGTTDIRALFPLAPYFAVADFAVKFLNDDKAKTAEMIQTIVGIKLPAGSQNVFLDQLFAAFSSDKEADQIAISAGKVLGDFTGRFTQPFVAKQAFDFFNMFREDGSIARDPNIMEGGGGFFEAATQRVMNKIPVLKEQLAEATPRFKEGDKIYREGDFFNRMIGVREIPNKTAEEKEIVKLSINPYSAYGASTGNKEIDTQIVRDSNKEILPMMREIMADPEYKTLDVVAKRLVVGQAIRNVVNDVKSMILADLSYEDAVKYYKLQFNRLPEDSRRFINAEFMKINGVTMDEAEAYDQLDDYKVLLQELKGGIF